MPPNLWYLCFSQNKQNEVPYLMLMLIIMSIYGNHVKCVEMNTIFGYYNILMA